MIMDHEAWYILVWNISQPSQAVIMRVFHYIFKNNHYDFLLLSIWLTYTKAWCNELRFILFWWTTVTTKSFSISTRIRCRWCCLKWIRFLRFSSDLPLLALNHSTFLTAGQYFSILHKKKKDYILICFGEIVLGKLEEN